MEGQSVVTTDTHEEVDKCLGERSWKEKLSTVGR